MVQENPFYYTLAARPEDFVGRWELVDTIVTDLCRARAESWAVFGGRRFGKSSVLEAIKARLLPRLSTCEPGQLHVHPFYVGLKSCDTVNVRTVYAGILRQLYRSLRGQRWVPFELSRTGLGAFVGTYHRKEADFYDYQDILENLAEAFEEKDIPLRLVLLLDEVECITEFSWAESYFFNQQRGLIYDGFMAHNYRIVLTGSVKVSKIKQSGSPFLNPMQYKHLTTLSDADIQTLINRGGSMPQDAQLAILQQSGGHPFIAQYLLHHFWLDGFTHTTAVQVAWMAEQMRDKRAADFEDWWQAIGDSGRYAYAALLAENAWVHKSNLLRFAQGAIQPLNWGLSALCYHGLIKQHEDLVHYRVAGQLFADWFKCRSEQHLAEAKNDLGDTHLPQEVRIYYTIINGTINGPVATGNGEATTQTGNGAIYKSQSPVQQDFDTKKEKSVSKVFKSGYALIIGVGADLPNTVDDAQGLADILKDTERCAYLPEQVQLLTSSYATRETILKTLDDLASDLHIESTVIIYFSGHGYQVSTSVSDVFFLLPYGYDVHRLKQTAISGTELIEKLRAIPAQKLLLLLDCCHAGGVGDAKSPGIESMHKSPLPPEATALFAKGSGWVLIASSQEDELSYCGKPYSAFTLALVEAFAGQGVAKKDGYVRVSDVALHAREVVPGRTKNRQHPILHFEHADNFVLAYYAGGGTQPKGLPFGIVPEIEPEPDVWRKDAGMRLSGNFNGPVAIDGSEAVVMSGVGAMYKPQALVNQHFGDHIEMNGDGNIIGGSQHRVVVNKSKDTDTITVETFLQQLKLLQQMLAETALDNNIEQAIVRDLSEIEQQACATEPQLPLILARLNGVLGLLATADGVCGIVDRVLPLAKQAIVWAKHLF